MNIIEKIINIINTMKNITLPIVLDFLYAFIPLLVKLVEFPFDTEFIILYINLRNFYRFFIFKYF